MEKEHILRLIFFLLSIILLRCIYASDDSCQPASCGPTEPIIRFPFRLVGRQPSWCGFSGFDLSCDEQNQTIIRLQPWTSHIVNRINYLSQDIYIDPDYCQGNEINSFNLTNTPFDYSRLQNYTFYNCSLLNLGYMYPAVPFPCLNSANYSVFVVQSGLFPAGIVLYNCKVMMTTEVPIQWNGDIRSDLELTWLTPSCRGCEMQGKACGLKTENGQTGCLASFNSHGFSSNAKFGLSLGIGVPTLVFVIGLIYHVASRARNYTETHRRGIDLFSIATIPRPPSRMGLDEPTIAAYPKTMLGESFTLPNDDSTCVICLSDYKPKELLKTIPECKHYFHADCIDEWLKLNATCPVCRKSPESSSLVKPCSTTSTTSVD